MSKPETITIDDVEYVRKDKANQPAKMVEGMTCVIVRTFSAGVFAGFLKERHGKEVTLLNSRRLWYWSGAASLSQLAVDGVSKPEECKFPAFVPETTLTEAIEIILLSQKAWESICGVKVWKQ